MTHPVTEGAAESCEQIFLLGVYIHPVLIRVSKGVTSYVDLQRVFLHLFLLLIKVDLQPNVTVVSLHRVLYRNILSISVGAGGFRLVWG